MVQVIEETLQKHRQSRANVQPLHRSHDGHMIVTWLAHLQHAVTVRLQQWGGPGGAGKKRRGCTAGPARWPQSRGRRTAGPEEARWKACVEQRLHSKVCSVLCGNTHWILCCSVCMKNGSGELCKANGISSDVMLWSGDCIGDSPALPHCSLPLPSQSVHILHVWCMPTNYLYTCTGGINVTI